MLRFLSFSFFRSLLALLWIGLALAGWGAPEAVDMCVDSVQPPNGLMVGQAGHVVVRVSNKGNGTISSARFLLFVDGQPAGEARLSEPLASQSRTEVSLPWTPTVAGKHSVAVEAKPAGNDSDLSNNRLEQSVVVGEKVLSGELHLTSLDVKEDETPRGVPVEVMLSVDNAGDRPVHKVIITLFEDQQKIVSKTFYTTVEGNSQKDFVIGWVPKKLGKYHIAAVLGQANTLPAAKLPNSASKLVTVVELEGFNLSITQVNVPKQARVDQEQVAEVVVRNSGALDAKEVKVSVLAEGARLSSARGELVKAGQEGHFELRWIPRSAGTSHLRFVVEGTGRAQNPGKKLEREAVVEVRP